MAGLLVGRHHYVGLVEESAPEWQVWCCLSCDHRYPIWAHESKDRVGARPQAGEASAWNSRALCGSVMVTHVQQGFLEGKAGDHEILCQCEVLFQCKIIKFGASGC